MFLEDVDVTQSVFDELWSNQLTSVVPFVAVSGKDAVPEKIVPVLQKYKR